MQTRAEIVIIGGGIAGASIACTWRAWDAPTCSCSSKES